MGFTHNEWKAALAGLVAGLHKSRKKRISAAVTTNTEPFGVGKPAMIGYSIDKVYLASRSTQSVVVPIRCIGVNLGVGLFTCLIKWDSQLTYTGYTEGTFGPNIEVDDTNALTNRELYVSGDKGVNMPDNADFTFVNLNFDMSDVSDSVDKVRLEFIRTTSTNYDDCTLLTYFAETQYGFITPFEINNGYFYFDPTKKEENEITVPGPSYYPGYSGGSGGGSGGSSGGTSATGTLEGYMGGSGGDVTIEFYDDNGNLLGSWSGYIGPGNFSIDFDVPLVFTPGSSYTGVKAKIKTPKDGYLIIPTSGFRVRFVTVIPEDAGFPKPNKIVLQYDLIEIVDDVDIEIIEVPNPFEEEQMASDEIDISDNAGGFTPITITMYSQEIMDELNIGDNAGGFTPITITITDVDADEDIEINDGCEIEKYSE